MRSLDQKQKKDLLSFYRIFVFFSVCVYNLELFVLSVYLMLKLGISLWELQQLLITKEVLFEELRLSNLNFDIIMFLKLKSYKASIFLINSLGVVIIARMGIKEWFVPQISEHWPEYIPIRLENRKIWFKRPGRASTFVPKDGIVQEWITSADVTNERIRVFTGR